MNSSLIKENSNFINDNKELLLRYLYISIIGLLIFISALYFSHKIKYVLLLAGGLIVFASVLNPRIALYQFLFVLFINTFAVERPAVMFLDFSAVIVVCAALFDFLLKKSTLKSIPGLYLNYLIFILN